MQPTSSSADVARKLVDDHFLNDDPIVVFSDADVELSSLNQREKRDALRTLDQLWTSLPNAGSISDIKSSVSESKKATAVFWCEGKVAAIAVLAKIYERIRLARAADGYDAGYLGDGVGFIRLWIDRHNNC